MTRRSLISALPLPVLLPRVLSAMGDTVRISIDGSDLASPVEITEDVGVFNVWSGPSTTSNEGQSFIVNWAGGAVQPSESQADLPSIFSHHENQRAQDLSCPLPDRSLGKDRVRLHSW